jgi:hypothetical protein
MRLVIFISVSFGFLMLASYGLGFWQKPALSRVKRFWRIWIYLTQWMPNGWNPDEMTKEFWEGD